MINNYLLVKASDAHAWVELYFEDAGWVRVDPTVTATRDETTAQMQEGLSAQENPYFTKINHYFLYTKYIINRWILDYDRVKQMQILKELLSDTLYLLKFVFSFLALIALSALAFYLLKSSRCQDKLMCEMQKLLKTLKKRNISKEPHESMQDFLTKTQVELGINLDEINRLYHELKYKKELDNLAFDALKKEIQIAKRNILDL